MDKLLKSIIRVIYISCLIVAFYSSILNAESIKIFKINILGNEKIEKDAIFPYISVKVGDIFKQDKVKDDVKSIFKMGYFENVLVNYNKIEGKGVEVSYIVVEKPYIKSVNFKGFKELKKVDVTKELLTKPFTIINIDNIKKDVQKITDLYQEKGYYQVKVSYKVSDPVEHQVVVTFDIVEGMKSKIDHVYFVGNKNLSKRILQKSIFTRPYNLLLSWIMGTGYLKKSELEKDSKRLESAYSSYGYVRAKVFDPEIKVTHQGKYIDVTFKIEEGKCYKFGKIDIVDPEDNGSDIREVSKKISCKYNDIFDNRKINNDIKLITDFYSDKGYAFADVAPKTSIFDDNLTANITFIVERGDLFEFREIKIKGNSITRDKVIRRELRVYEQEKYTGTGLKRSRANLKRTGYFSEADIKTEKVGDNKIDVIVDVKETPTGSVSFGGGFSSAESFILTGQTSQANLFGKGYKLKLNAALSGISQRYDISFTDPAILDTDTSLQVSLYNIDYKYDNYDTLKKGFGLSFGEAVSDFVRWDMGYFYETVKVYNLGDNVAQYIKNEKGTTSIGATTFSVSRDTRDDFYYPTTGAKQKIYTEWSSSIFGSQADYYKVTGEGTWFTPVSKKNKLILAFRGKLGYMDNIGDDEIPAWERFYVGGISTIRGFKTGEAGPRDEVGDVKGGVAEVITNTELRFPIFEDIGLNGFTFFDCGRAYDDDEDIDFDLRKSVGLGLNWRSPLGLVTIVWGYNLSPKYDEKKSVFGFNMGTMF